MSSSAWVALVVSRVTMGFLVMIADTGVVLGSSDMAVTCGPHKHQLMSSAYLPLPALAPTLNARSLAVKIPLSPSSSSTTNTQSVRLAAHSWLASLTLMLSGTVSAGEGRRDATVPLAAACLRREGADW